MISLHHFKEINRIPSEVSSLGKSQDLEKVKTRHRLIFSETAGLCEFISVSRVMQSNGLRGKQSL